jgi:hypothetical protein
MTICENSAIPIHAVIVHIDNLHENLPAYAVPHLFSGRQFSSNDKDSGR